MLLFPRKCPGFIEENEACGIDEATGDLIVLSLLNDIGTQLLCRDQRLFLSDKPSFLSRRQIVHSTTWTLIHRHRAVPLLVAVVETEGLAIGDAARANMLKK